MSVILQSPFLRAGSCRLSSQPSRDSRASAGNFSQRELEMPSPRGPKQQRDPSLHPRCRTRHPPAPAHRPACPSRSSRSSTARLRIGRSPPATAPASGVSPSIPTTCPKRGMISPPGPGIRENEVTLFHEPILLETGGGLKNIASWIRNEPLLVHNGDIFSTMPLEKLIAAHEASGLPVTLAMRSGGADKRIALDDSLTRVTDVRNELGRAKGTHVFSGIYCVNPGFPRSHSAPRNHLRHPRVPRTRETRPPRRHRARRRRLARSRRPRVLSACAPRTWRSARPSIPLAIIEPGATVENSIIGPGALVAAGALVRDSVVWPDSRILGGAVLDDCIVYSGHPIQGAHRGTDV